MAVTTDSAGAAIRPVTLEGRFVKLEPLGMEHIPALVDAANEQRDTYDWTWVPEDEASMTAYARTALDLRDSREAIPFATIQRETGRAIGTTRFANFEHLPWPDGNPHQRGVVHPDGVEIGWTWLAASVQRTPINTEAKYLMLRHAFETWRVHVVRLKTDERNARSRAAIERIGGRLDGIVRAHAVGRDGAIQHSALLFGTRGGVASDEGCARSAARALKRPGTPPGVGSGVGCPAELDGEVLERHPFKLAFAVVHDRPGEKFEHWLPPWFDCFYLRRLM